MCRLCGGSDAMACVHAATAKASTIAKCLITLSSLQWLTMANNDGKRRSVQSAGSRAYFCRIHPRATSAFPADHTKGHLAFGGGLCGTLLCEDQARPSIRLHSHGKFLSGGLDEGQSSVGPVVPAKLRRSRQVFGKPVSATTEDFSVECDPCWPSEARVTLKEG